MHERENMKFSPKWLFFIVPLFYIFFNSAYGKTNEVSTQQQNNSSFITVSDFHFNPLHACQEQIIPCPALQELQYSQVEDWNRILEKYDQRPIQYKEDTNYLLLKSSFNALEKLNKKVHPQFVIVLGDMFPHDFRRLFIKYSGDQQEKDFKKFAAKTMQFLAVELGRIFSNIDVYFVVGNHDTDDENNAAPIEFFKTIGPYWKKLITQADTASFNKDFMTGGYYIIDLPQNNNHRLIILNSILFSNHAEGDEVDFLAKKQLAWLDFQLKNASLQNKKVLIAGHIPMAIDVNAILETTPITVEAMWKTKYSDSFVKILKKYSHTVVGILMGHLHIDGFEIMKSSATTLIPVIQTPSISPIYDNNPAFKLIIYDKNSLSLKNFITYFYNIHQSKWKKEYDFNEIYQPDCRGCDLIHGMLRLKQYNKLSEYYKYFYAVSEDAKPITKGYWLPFYWCQIYGLQEDDYKNCIALVKKQYRD